MQEKMVIAYVCDTNYVKFLQKSIESIKRYNKNVEFCVLSSSNINLPDVKTFNITPDKSNFKFRRNDRMKDGVYYKFYLPILPYDKILYIDCDVICQRPLDELWNTKCDFICATESHQYGKVQAQQLNLQRYALTGMMLMNLKALREADFTNRCLDRLAVESPRFHDETIINLEFNSRITFIDKKFNYCHNRPYDNPIEESDAYLLHYVGRDKDEMLALKNFYSLNPLKEILKNKTVAIVGNASSILGTNKGQEIDNHDIVIRFNKGFPFKDPLAIGTRTDILFLACTLLSQELAYFNARYTVRRSKLCKNTCTFNIEPVDRKELAQQRTKFVSIGKKAQPSTGFVAINFALSTECKCVDLYGFDFFKTDTYYNPKGYQTLHNGDKEAEKVLEYQKYGLVSIK